MGRGTQDSEAADEVVVDGHDGAGVVELSAVVRRGEESHQLPVRLELVAILHDLWRKMCFVLCFLFVVVFREART